MCMLVSGLDHVQSAFRSKLLVEIYVTAIEKRTSMTKTPGKQLSTHFHLMHWCRDNFPSATGRSVVAAKGTCM